MCKHFVIVFIVFSLPAFASDAIELRQDDRLNATLINEANVMLNERGNLLFDPHTLLSGDVESALPDYCLLAADAALNGSLLMLTPRNILCVTDQQQVLESALSGFATVNGVATVPFECVRRNTNGCSEARVAPGLTVDFTITEPAMLRAQR